MEVSKLVGEKMRVYRSIKNYTQEYMADQIKVSQSTYAKLENGQTFLTVERLLEVATVLDVSVYELLPENLKKKAVDVSDLSLEQAELMKLKEEVQLFRESFISNKTV